MGSHRNSSRKDFDVIVPPSLSVIEPYLRVANEVERERPRVAFLCRFHALERAHKVDPQSTGRGVPQFKTILLERLEKDHQASLAARKRSSDATEIKAFYQEYLLNYIDRLKSQDDRAMLAKAYQTAAILYDVLLQVNKEVGKEEQIPQTEMEEVVRTEDEVMRNAARLTYNILPLDEEGDNEAIMQLKEVQAATKAVRNTAGLRFVHGERGGPGTNGVGQMRARAALGREDILDWLKQMFGFQEDNVKNQREHLILLLANNHIRLKPTPEPLDELSMRAVDVVMNKLLKNYKSWCKYLRIDKKLDLPSSPDDIMQWKLIYTALFLLIWGEAANVRFIPECLCYIFHHMKERVIVLLKGTDSPVAEVEEGFLKNIIQPVYNIVAAEAKVCNAGKNPHSAWKNYDDFNEFFWTKECFKSLGWPWFNREKSSNFFVAPPTSKSSKDGASSRMRKINFVEHRSFVHIFHSFDRMWIFLILLLQGMIIIGFSTLCTGDKLFLRAGEFDEHCRIDTLSVFKSILSIFITEAFLRFIIVVLDIVLSFGQYRTMSSSSIARLGLRLVWYFIWTVFLGASYPQMWNDSGNRSSVGAKIKDFVGQNWNKNIYLAAVGIYLVPYLFGFALYVVPCLVRCVENSNFCLFRGLTWWSQSSLYVGRGMQQSLWTVFCYSTFWIVMLVAKAFFSYFVMIKPLVGPTYDIMRFHNVSYVWHEFFPSGTGNLGAIVSIWAPIILVYFFDLQIWYAIFSTIVGGAVGAMQRLGEIRNLKNIRMRFPSFHSAFSANLIPSARRMVRTHTLSSSYTAVDKKEDKDQTSAAKFGQLWNEVIQSFREEDLINDSEKLLLQVPYTRTAKLQVIQMPPVFLASKIPEAVRLCQNFAGGDVDLFRKIGSDKYMDLAVKEVYEILKIVLLELVKREKDRQIIEELFKEAEKRKEEERLLQSFYLTKKVEEDQPTVLKRLVDIVKNLSKLLVQALPPLPGEKSASAEAFNEELLEELRQKVVKSLQDMFEIVVRDLLEEHLRNELSAANGVLSDSSSSRRKRDGERFQQVVWPPPDHQEWREMIQRFHALLTTSDLRMALEEVPANLEARRRLTFFTNSLFMNMPRAPRVRYMQSFSVMTPYYEEEVMYTKRGFSEENEDGVSILFYLQKIYPDEWRNFLERVSRVSGTKCQNEHDVMQTQDGENEIRMWTSYRGQTLQRTVRGMSYYRRAIQLQAFLDMASTDELAHGYRQVLDSALTVKANPSSIYAQLQAISDLKFTYVVTAQIYGQQKRNKAQQATDIANLLKTNECLRVAYIDEVEEGTSKKYYSVLVKGVGDQDLEVYRIRLPGPAKLGEGKPENQNHAIVFTRGEALQTIDMNQDNYLEEAFKMRNLLQEFYEDHGVRAPTILGVREHIFTGSVSSLAWFMSLQELSFVTLGQRVLATPLKVRFHYGHPDVFDRIFHITRGGISKASRVINISEDIFVGFQTTLRRGNVTHHEYIQVGKGRDVGFNQVSLFEAKVASGNGEQVLSRDVYRLGHGFDFFRMLSMYYTTVGFYANTLIVLLTVYVFLYGRVYMALSGVESALLNNANLTKNRALENVMVTYAVAQLGFLMALPMVMELGLELGFKAALVNFLVMQLQGASVFFTFSLGTKSHYFGRTLLHGGAKYRATGRGFVVKHEKYSEIYRLFSRSHFTKGLEILFLLSVYTAYSSLVGRTGWLYLLVTISMWFLVASFLFGPFVFNPSGFEWLKTVEDWNDWMKWITSPGGIGKKAVDSWEAWWEEEQEHLRYTGLFGRISETILSLRFLLYQYGVVYHLDVAQKPKLRSYKGRIQPSRSILVYAVSWLIILIVVAALKVVSIGRKRYSSDFQLLFRLLKVAFFCAVCIIFGLLWGLTYFSVSDVFAAILAFIPTGWFVLLVAQAWRPFFESIKLWESIKSLARAYEYAMGLAIFTPIAILAWFPFTNEFQSRLLFNTAFSRGLQISRILAGTKKTN